MVNYTEWPYVDPLFPPSDILQAGGEGGGRLRGAPK